ncbi:hypothetical protein [Cupriavidus plantarum]|uniref:hypothetical protein n=1 Tax=Cupriavidus plantarum TaxID=942865 RepID=UPI000F23014A|nr:hypothetical protein [Cupriavidus plantarum]RLK36174.1 hypothetical protein C7417_3951 [Cupriavidus plantarum]
MFHNAPKLSWWGVSMTCEVVVANRMGVALAADSADGIGGETYTFGACKIQQLSFAAPVGIMFFGAAELCGVSWELIVKAFRASLRRTTMCTLEDYATALVRFVEGNDALFPTEQRLALFRAMAVRSVRSLLAEVQSQQETGAVGSSPPAVLAQIRETLQGHMLPFGCSEMDLRKTIDTHMAWLSGDCVKEAANTEELRLVARELPLGKLCEAAVRNLYVNFRTISGAPPTGVVLVGFGDEDAFPGVLELQCYGLGFDKLITAGRGSVKKKVDHRNSVCIEAYAQTDAVEFFVGGYTNQIKETIGRAYRQHVGRFADAVMDATGGASDIEELLGRSAADFERQWSEELIRGNLEPLRAVVEGMSLEQLAELAEALVMLEAFKERTTRRTHSVGGPVDVAVITRSEGLVWIKRKHYFGSTLNYRFFHRQFEEQMT